MVTWVKTLYNDFIRKWSCILTIAGNLNKKGRGGGVNSLPETVFFSGSFNEKFVQLVIGNLVFFLSVENSDLAYLTSDGITLDFDQFKRELSHLESLKQCE